MEEAGQVAGVRGASSTAEDRAAGRRDGRPLLFYSAWPIDYHNREATRKAIGFAEVGYDVVYVTGVGTRNPRLSTSRKVLDRAARKLRGGGTSGPSTVAPGVRTSSVLVVPPRQLRPIAAFNAAWVERQLRSSLGPWNDAVAWIRQPTPEVVRALRRLAPAATVYECVDAYHHTPGITGRWREIAEAAERALVAAAAVVVVPGETLAERFTGWGADVRVVPHGVDLYPAPPAPSDRGAQTRVLGFVGTLDHRIDTTTLRHVALRHPEWKIRLIGPIQEGFHREAFADVPNISVEDPVPHEQLGATLTTFDVGLMPYRDSGLFRAMTPVKTLELMAAGRPAVARPSRALSAYSDLLYLAESPEQFEQQVERALAEDSPELVRQRRSVAEANAWDRRVDELRGLLVELGVPPTRSA